MCSVRLYVLVFSVSLFSSCALFKSANKTGGGLASSAAAVHQDSSKKKTDTIISKLKPYREIITAKAVTDSGLIIVHKVNDRYFFEIPGLLLAKDILVVNRISQGAANVRKGGLGYGGDQIGSSVIRFEKGPNNKLFIQTLSFAERSVDSSANGMYRSVKNSTLNPIAVALDAKTLSSDSSAVVVDVTDVLLSDNSLFYFSAKSRTSLGFGGLQKDKSYISRIQSFPINTEIECVITYPNGDETASFLLNASIVLLPEKAMQPRYFDQRVGYFFDAYWDYDVPQGVDVTKMITRFRLEPKDEDREKYLRGELVEPQKPIVYYIDPATPKKWMPYLIQGVNDWQKAFEKAGFKNAIYALKAPTNDSSFSLFDARHNAIVYKSSPIPNASGPHVHDPRTGEILETHINWYHNIQQLLQSWYMIQAGPNDCEARKMVFDDELMGQLIRFVCTHEVGHTLGLRHNMGASSTVPTDSLRSKTYLDKNGFCPSIMDYARFNYVAQSEDGLSREHIMPRIGIYDEWAIEWGYRWLPQLKSKEEEMVYMDKWISTELAKDKRLWWGEYEHSLLSVVIDPRRQTEDLGDDAMKAGYYGIQNLKKVMNHLREWTRVPGKGYEDLNGMYEEVVAQYGRYMMHVANNIGNKYWTEKTASQQGPVVKFIPKAIQKKAMQFLAKELFETPTWLYNKDIFSVIGGPGDYVYLSVQAQVINWLVSFTNYMTMSYAVMQQPTDAYSYDEFLTDMENQIWEELKTASPISFPRRNLQKAFTERLIQYSLPTVSTLYVEQKLQLDYYPLMQKHLRSLVSKIDKHLPSYKDETTQLHLKEIRKRLQQALNFTRYPQQTIAISPKGNQTGLSEYSPINDKDIDKLLKNSNSATGNGQVKSLPYAPCFLSMQFLLNQK